MIATIEWWGNLGSAVGGIAGTVVSFVSIILLYKVWKSENRLAYLPLQVETYRKAKNDINTTMIETINIVSKERIVRAFEISIFHLRVKMAFNDLEHEFPKTFVSSEYKEFLGLATKASFRSDKSHIEFEEHMTLVSLAANKVLVKMKKEYTNHNK